MSGDRGGAPTAFPGCDAMHSPLVADPTTWQELGVTETSTAPEPAVTVAVRVSVSAEEHWVAASGVTTTLTVGTHCRPVAERQSSGAAGKERDSNASSDAWIHCA